MVERLLSNDPMALVVVNLRVVVLDRTPTMEGLVPLIQHSGVSKKKHFTSQVLRLVVVGIFIFWLVLWNIFYFFHILGIIIPTDFHIFQRGRSTTFLAVSRVSF